MKTILTVLFLGFGRSVFSQTTIPVSSWEAELLQNIKDNERKSPTAAKEAYNLLEAFRSYHDAKKTRTFFDVSGRKLQEIKMVS